MTKIIHLLTYIDLCPHTACIVVEIIDIYFYEYFFEMMKFYYFLEWQTECC